MCVIASLKLSEFEIREQHSLMPKAILKALMILAIDASGKKLVESNRNFYIRINDSIEGSKF